jgi:hypothetical protein
MNDTASIFSNNIALGTLLLKQAHYNLLPYKNIICAYELSPYKKS